MNIVVTLFYKKVSPFTLWHIITCFLYGVFFSGVEGSNGWCHWGTGRLSARAVSLQQGKRCQGSGCPPRCCALSVGAAAGCFSLPETQFPFPPVWSHRRRAANKPQWLWPRRGLCTVSICELKYASHMTLSCFIFSFPNVEVKKIAPPHTHTQKIYLWHVQLPGIATSSASWVKAMWWWRGWHYAKIQQVRHIFGKVHPKMKILSLITHPHVVPNPVFIRLQNTN